MSEIHGTIHWTELNTRDVEAAKSYYAAICGWTYDAMPMDGGGTYVVAMQGDAMVCGMFDMADMPGMEGIPAHWLTYLAVDDVDAAVQATGPAGGMVLREPFDVPNVGRVAIVQDASGAAIGLMTPSDG